MLARLNLYIWWQFHKILQAPIIEISFKMTYRKFHSNLPSYCPAIIHLTPGVLNSKTTGFKRSVQWTKPQWSCFKMSKPLEPINKVSYYKPVQLSFERIFHSNLISPCNFCVLKFIPLREFSPGWNDNILLTLSVDLKSKVLGLWYRCRRKWGLKYNMKSYSPMIVRTSCVISLGRERIGVEN